MLSLLLLAAAAASAASTKHLEVNGTCYEEGIEVRLKTLEPFEGLFYARGNPSGCR